MPPVPAWSVKKKKRWTIEAFFVNVFWQPLRSPRQSKNMPFIGLQLVVSDLCPRALPSGCALGQRTRGINHITPRFRPITLTYCKCKKEIQGKSTLVLIRVENEAPENEDRSTKDPNLENEAPKTRKRSNLDRKRRPLNLENEAPKSRKRSSWIRWRQRMRPHLQRSTKSIPRFYKSLPTV